MKTQLLTILFFSLWASTLLGQHPEKVDYGFDILRQAESSFCKADTTQTIKILEAYTDKFPNTGTTLLISKKLAELYLATNQSQLAISLLTKTIEINPKSCPIIRDTCGLFDELTPSTIKADICVVLSKAYTLHGEYSAALEFLKLADTKYLPSYGGCANGMIMYQTKLSLDFADYYLLTGDTTKAIDRLIQFFLSEEYYDEEVTAKLKSILLLSYAQEQISVEINNGLNTMRLIKEKEDDYGHFLLISFFGRTIKKWNYSDLQFSKDYYRKNKNILALMNE